MRDMVDIHHAYRCYTEQVIYVNSVPPSGGVVAWRIGK